MRDGRRSEVGTSSEAPLLKDRERILVNEMLRQGWGGPDIKSALFFNFDFRITLAEVIDIRRDHKLRQIERENPGLVEEARRIIEEMKKVQSTLRVDAIEMTRAMRLEVDERLVEMIQEGSGSIRDLTSLSKYLFEREQLLTGKPTSITQSYKEMSDEDLIEELRKLNAIEVEPSQVKGSAEGDSDGVKEAPGAGADTLLGSSSEAV